MLNSKTAKAEKGERIEKHLLITRYDAARAARGEMLKIEDVLEILSTPLLGVVPESQDVLRASNLGSPVTLSNKTSAPARAYIAAAKKLKGEEAESAISGSRGLFGKLFGRRAASICLSSYEVAALHLLRASGSKSSSLTSEPRCDRTIYWVQFGKRSWR